MSAIDSTADTSDAQLVADLVKAQAAFPTITKNQTATIPGKNGRAGYSYTYAALGDVLTAVRPVLSEHGLALVQRTIREGANVILVTELRHVGGGVLSSEVEVGQSASTPQQFGGALTYLRRYEIVTLLGIAAEEDTDAQHVEPARSTYGEPPATPAWALPASDEDKATVLGLLEVVVGDRGTARQYAAALSAKCGGFPDAVAKWLVALPEWQATATSAPPEEPPVADPAEAETLAAEVFGKS